MIISGLVPTQYSNIVTGINSLIASGVADVTLNEFYLYVDDALYTGTFNAVVPNSGSFYVIGSGTYFSPTATCTIETSGQGVFNWLNTNIIGELTSSWLFHVASGSNLLFTNSDLAAFTNGVYNSGFTGWTFSSIGGSGIGIVASGGELLLSNTSISNFNNGIYGSTIQVNNSEIFDVDKAIDMAPNSSIISNRTLIHHAGSGIVHASGSIINLSFCTIDAAAPIAGSGGVFDIRSTIMNGVTYCINGPLATGCILQNVGLYPSGWLASDVVIEPNVTNQSNKAPLFNNTTIGDYRLKFAYDGGSPYVAFTDKNIPSGVTLTSEPSNIALIDDRGSILNTEYNRYIYSQDNTLLTSDYDKEVEYAHFINSNRPLKSIVTTTAKSEVLEQTLLSSFSSDGIHPEPWDWDLKTFSSPEIVDHKSDLEYIIPRSYLNIRPIMESKLGFLPNSVQYQKLTINKHIKAFNKTDPRGLSYDYDLSEPGSPLMWLLEGRNQSLQKQNVYTGEILEDYPILCPYMGVNGVTTVSGLLYVGPAENRFRFIFESDPTIEVLSESNKAHFKWIDTTINRQFDARGILSYKNNLYITGSWYSEDIYDRTKILEGDSAGKILRYVNNNRFTHYLTSLDNLDNRVMSLTSGNALPTDITVYEDGNLFVADYANISGLYRYKLAYDYALVEERFDNDSRVLLREFYTNVDF